MPNTPDLTSGQVMDKSASLLNDTAKSTYTYTVQLPYLNLALQSLQENFELSEVAVTDTVSAVMTVVAGVDHIGFGTSGLRLPSDLIEPQLLWERTSGIDPYVPMTRLDFLPRYMEGVEMQTFQWYVWEAQEIRFFPCIQDNDIKMDYIKNLFVAFTDVTGGDQVNVINAASYLEFKTAALCAKFIAENPSRAQLLEGEAILALDRAMGIGTKGRQNITTRRRPFRASWKRRSFM